MKLQCCSPTATIDKDLPLRNLRAGANSASDALEADASPGNMDVSHQGIGDDEDEDVTSEKLRVQSGMACDDMVVIKGLRKVYPSRLNAPPKVAVNDLWFGIPQGQCFGFLGVNGAGNFMYYCFNACPVLFRIC
jgi:ABC-type glutathione transport system ATPase component